MGAERWHTLAIWLWQAAHTDPGLWALPVYSNLRSSLFGADDPDEEVCISRSSMTAPGSTTLYIFVFGRRKI